MDKLRFMDNLNHKIQQQINFAKNIAMKQVESTDELNGLLGKLNRLSSNIETQCFSEDNRMTEQLQIKDVTFQDVVDFALKYGRETENALEWLRDDIEERLYVVKADIDNYEDIYHADDLICEVLDQANDCFDERAHKSRQACDELDISTEELVSRVKAYNAAAEALNPLLHLSMDIIEEKIPNDDGVGNSIRKSYVGLACGGEEIRITTYTWIDDLPTISLVNLVKSDEEMEEYHQGVSTGTIEKDKIACVHPNMRILFANMAED